VIQPRPPLGSFCSDDPSASSVPRLRWLLQPGGVRLWPGTQRLHLSGWQRAHQHRHHRSGAHRLLQSQQARLLGLFVEAKVHDGPDAQGHTRPKRGCARSRPGTRQHRGLSASHAANEKRSRCCLRIWSVSWNWTGFGYVAWAVPRMRCYSPQSRKTWGGLRNCSAVLRHRRSCLP